MRSKFTLIGETNHHLGPRLDFARVQISIETAAQFEIIDVAAANVEERQAGYVYWGVLGLLGVLRLADCAPLKSLRVTVEKIERHDIIRAF